MAVSVKKRFVNICWIVLFLAFFVFYTRIEPIMVCDPDDWTYISYFRVPYPKIGLWNPAKVFPETFTGILGGIAAFAVKPIINDYLGAITIVFAFVVSLFIVLYTIAFYKFIVKRFELSGFKGVFVVLMFLAMHFLMFKSAEKYNIYMLTATDLNCFMNYLIPALLGCILAFGVIDQDLTIMSREWNGIKGGCLLLCAYLAVFSNIFVNVIFVFAVGVSFLYKTILMLKKKEKINKSYIISCRPYWIIFIFEIICLGFEASGGRAASFAFDFKKQLAETIVDLKTIIQCVNREVLIITLCTILIAVFVLCFEKNKKEADRAFLRNLCLNGGCAILCIFYMVCLCTRVGLHKLTRTENIFVMFIYYDIIFGISLAYLVHKFKKIAWCMPLILYMTLIQVFMGNAHVYKGSIPYYWFDAKKCERVNENILQQFIEADQAGKEEFDLILPENNLGDYTFTGDRIAQTLYNHRIVSKRMKVNIRKDVFLE